MKDRLQSLERQFNLPPQAIHLQYLVRRVLAYVQRGCQHHVAGGDQATVVQFLLAPAGLLAQPLALGLGHLWRFAPDNHPGPQRRLRRSIVDQHRHIAEVLASRQAVQVVDQVERAAILLSQT